MSALSISALQTEIPPQNKRSARLPRTRGAKRGERSHGGKEAQGGESLTLLWKIVVTDARSSGRSEREGDKSLQTEESIASILMEHNTTRRRKISVGDRRPHRLSMMVRSLPALEGLLFKRKDDSLYEQLSPARPKHEKVQNRGKWSTQKLAAHVLCFPLCVRCVRALCHRIQGFCV